VSHTQRFRASSIASALNHAEIARASSNAGPGVGGRKRTPGKLLPEWR